MYRLSLGFFAGTLSIQLFSTLPILHLFYTLPIIAAVIVMIWRFWHQPIFGFVAAFIIGSLYAMWAANSIIKNRIPSELEGKTLIAEGQIIGIPDRQSDALRFYMDIDLIKQSQNSDQQLFQGKVKLGWYRGVPAQMISGERWQLAIRLKRPSGFLNKSGFDYEKWLFSNGVLGTGYVKTSGENQKLADSESWRLDHIRQALYTKIQEAIENRAVSAIVGALSVAVRHDISPDQWELFRITGTSHLMAISGLHIGMIAGFALLPVTLIWLLIPSLYLRFPVRTAALVFGALLATGYALLAGFTVPTQRALIMVLFGLFALLVKRKIPLSVILLSAVFVVLLIDPLAGLSEGFWLSFGSVALIFYLLIQQQAGLLYRLIKIQAFLSLGMIPVTAAFFGNASLISPVANFIAIPFVTLFLAPVLLLSVVSLLITPSIANFLMPITEWGVEWLLRFLNYLSEINHSSFAFADLSAIYIFSALLGVLIFALPSGLVSRWLGLLLVLPIFLYSPNKLEHGEIDLSVLDVGQGLSIVVQTQNHNLVFDAGERFSDSYDLGRIVVLPFLQAQAIRQIDKMVISHLDKDHRGGAASILEKLPVIQLLSSEKVTIHKQQAQLCKSGQRWEWDGVQFEFLNPLLEPSSEQQGWSQNNRSCVLRVSNQYHSVLLTADIEEETEELLLDNIGENLKADVLLIPHHGSKTSSSSAFIDAVSPKMAIASAGYRNRFRFPAKSVMQRYQDRNIETYSTNQQGGISLYIPDERAELKANALRVSMKKFWHR